MIVRRKERRTDLALILRELTRTWQGTVGLVITIGMIAVALAAPLLAPEDPLAQDYEAIASPPSVSHPMGTDFLGRDQLSRVIYGSRVSLSAGLLSVGLATLIGSVIGLVAGFRQGAIGEVLMRLMDALASFPTILLALAITSVLGPGLLNAMLGIAVVTISSFGRLTRGQVLSVEKLEYVTAARSVGVSSGRIMTRHILPNIVAPIIVQASLSVGNAITVEASLSFLGLGVQPPTPSWGGMLREGYGYTEMAPWLPIFPGLAIFFTVLGVNLLGTGLRVALDPKLRDSRRG